MDRRQNVGRPRSPSDNRGRLRTPAVRGSVRRSDAGAYPLPSRPWRHMAGMLGNRGTQHAIESLRRDRLLRVPLTPEEREENLTAEPYASSEQLQNAYDNAPMLRTGASGEAVALVQQGLLDDGVPLPLSTTQGTQPPDGLFGPETAQGVRAFQDRHDLLVDGIVGRETLGALQELAGRRTAPPSGETTPTEPEPEIPPLSTAEYVIQVLRSADTRMLDALRADGAFLDGMQALMSPAQFGEAAACLCLVVPGEVQHPAEAKAEALRIMAAQLAGDPATTRRAIDRVRGLIIPANRLSTDYPPFSSLAGTATADGRTWDTVRGIGNTPLGDLRYSTFPEENLLGIPCTATYTPTSGPQAGIPQALGQYPEGYSVATHEFAHSLHGAALTDDDSETIDDAYEERKDEAEDAPTDTDMWVDGREGCYASTSVAEFYAQLSNAYLGTNAGTDAVTGDTRHNGKPWVRAHEPEVYGILERVYAGSQVEGTNPVSAPLAGGAAAPEPAEGAATAA